jgi:hypothetical protein
VQFEPNTTVTLDSRHAGVVAAEMFDLKGKPSTDARSTFPIALNDQAEWLLRTFGVDHVTRLAERL